MQRIVPNVWCQGNAEDAGHFYAAALPDASSEVVASYPTENLPDFQRELAGQPLVVDVTVSGYRIRLINAGDEFRPTPALSLIVNMDPEAFSGGVDEARDKIETIWESFTEGGEVRMPLGEYSHSKLYGWVEDRFGVNWQLMHAEPGQKRYSIVIPQFLFSGAADQAKQAIDFYTDLFPDSDPETNDQKSEEDAGILFPHFTLAGQSFSAVDGGLGHDFTFTPGLSLEFNCIDQQEIDTLWSALSAVPEAEQCGWLVDRFGVSWQIVPHNMGGLLQHEGAFHRMLDMKKIVIADL